MQQKVTAFIEKHRMLSKGATILVGVSGGPDSMALLHYLHTVQEKWDARLVVLSVDHQLRGTESRADLNYVEQICHNWKIEFVGSSVDVAAYKLKHRVGTEVAARELRYRFFAEQMKKYDADYLVLGHHGDDQVETMLMRLVRAADSSVFHGIPLRRKFAGGYIVRPFLCLTKQEIVHYCNEHNLQPRIDSSNDDTEYTRNFYRKRVIPLLKEKNCNIHTTVQHLSEALHADEQFLQEAAYNMFQEVVVLHKEKRKVSFEISAFHSYPTALQRRTFHLILNYLYDELPKNISYVHEEHFFQLLGSYDGNVQIDFPHNLKVTRSYQNVMFHFPNEHPQKVPSFHELLEIPGKVELPDGSSIVAKWTEQPNSDTIYSYSCKLDSVALPLHIRTRKAGDRMTLQGMKGSKKIKDIFIDLKVPLHDRDCWPIVTDNHGVVLWIVGLKKGQPSVSGETTSFIQLSYNNRNVQEGH